MIELTPEESSVMDIVHERHAAFTKRVAQLEAEVDRLQEQAFDLTETANRERDHLLSVVARPRGLTSEDLQGYLAGRSPEGLWILKRPEE